MLHFTKAKARDAMSKNYLCLNLRLHAQCNHQSRFYSSETRFSNEAYKSTIKNLAVGKHTRVMFQGFTGKQATVNATQSIKYGTNVVGGVSPNKSGLHVGLPVYPTVREAIRYLKPDATSVFVSAPHAASAIMEAIEAEISLISAVAEHIPVHELLRIHSALRAQSKSRLLGPNSPGMLHAPSRCRIGFMPYPQFLPGVIGIVAKSGTLGYEAVASTTRAGLGQSYVVGVGGDALAGTSLREGLELVWEDVVTEGVVIIGEVGGDGELEVAEFVEQKRREGGLMKPILGLIAGITAPPNRTMGHSGAFISSFMGGISAEAKLKAFKHAGIATITHPGHAGERMKQLLSTDARFHSRKQPRRNQQAREMHTLCIRRPMAIAWQASQIQVRYYQIGPEKLIEYLKRHDFPVFATDTSRLETSANTEFSLCFAICRSSRSPCIVISSPHGSFPMISLPFSYNDGPDQGLVKSMLAHMNLPTDLYRPLHRILSSIWSGGNAIRDETDPGFRVYFDNAAYRSCQRHSHIWALRDEERMTPEEVQAGEYGIVYIKLAEDSSAYDNTIVKQTLKPHIGCLVNGAGLAMITNDVLVHYGASPINFIDTGGKATNDTIKECFRWILLDKRAKGIFVNVFSGLTLCDTFASGIILAFKEYREQLTGIPVVVRLRGTNEEEGQRMLRESNLPGVYAFDDLDAAVQEVIRLAGR